MLFSIFDTQFFPPSRVGWLVLGCFLWGARGKAGQEAQATPPKEAVGVAGPLKTVVGYPVEAPGSAGSETGNILEILSRKLSRQIAGTAGETGAPVKGLVPPHSWEAAGKYSQEGEDCLFAVHGYDFVQFRRQARMEALLTPTWVRRPGLPETGPDRQPVTCEFVILRPRREGKFNMADFLGRTVLVEGGGCGELVYRWLDCRIAQDTGNGRRESLAGFRPAANGGDAILSVYFGEAAGCVVTREAWEEALRANPKGLAGRLELVATSPPLLRHVIACPSQMPETRRRALQSTAAGLRLPRDVTGDWVLLPPSSRDLEALEALETLEREWEARPGVRKPTPPGPGQVPGNGNGNGNENGNGKRPFPGRPGGSPCGASRSLERRTP